MFISVIKTFLKKQLYFIKHVFIYKHIFNTQLNSTFVFINAEITASFTVKKLISLVRRRYFEGDIKEQELSKPIIFF